MQVNMTTEVAFKGVFKASDKEVAKKMYILTKMADDTVEIKGKYDPQKRKNISFTDIIVNHMHCNNIPGCNKELKNKIILTNKDAAEYREAMHDVILKTDKMIMETTTKARKTDKSLYLKIRNDNMHEKFDAAYNYLFTQSNKIIDKYIKKAKPITSEQLDSFNNKVQSLLESSL